ncbi:MAG: hypothetical protein A2X52_17970 [Candidatus Rokubacteria bacterium GWC2_70_16]|nr:MAG: hypothetical protein A2X52_17970 [Candidatus Rokubacteria bacterium GWC2_70_16]
MKIDRRQLLATGLAGGATALLGSRLAHAQAEALRIGALTPLTGGGAVYGTTMARTYALLAEEINKAVVQAASVSGFTGSALCSSDTTVQEAPIAYPKIGEHDAK